MIIISTYIKKEAKNCEDCPHRPPQSITPSSSTHFSDLPKKQNRYRRHGKWIVTEKKNNLKQKLAKRRTGLRPNWDEHNAEKCSIINYFSDRENTELILLREEIHIENSCIYCGECEKCKKFQECRNEF